MIAIGDLVTFRWWRLGNWGEVWEGQVDAIRADGFLRIKFSYRYTQGGPEYTEHVWRKPTRVHLYSTNAQYLSKHLQHNSQNNNTLFEDTQFQKSTTPAVLFQKSTTPAVFVELEALQRRVGGPEALLDLLRSIRETYELGGD
jgi:hypothetical protein